MQKVKIVLTFFFLLLGVILFYWLQETALIWQLLALLFCWVTAGIVFIASDSGKIFLNFLQQAIIEAKKVTWSSRQEIMSTTIFIVLIVLLLAIFLGIMDAILFNFIKLLTGK